MCIILRIRRIWRNIDWSTVWLLFGGIMKYAGYIGFVIVMFILLAIPQLQYRKNKKHYFTITEDYESYLKDKESGELA